MPRLPGPDPIEFLVGRRFPDFCSIQSPKPDLPIGEYDSSIADKNDEYQKHRLKEINDYKNKLHSSRRFTKII